MSNMVGLKIPADSGIKMEIVQIAEDNGDNGLRSLQKEVGGFIEIVRISEADMVRMVLDEGGKLKGKPFNERASLLYAGYYISNDPIVGDVIVLGHHVDPGEGGMLHSFMIDIDNAEKWLEKAQAETELAAGVYLVKTMLGGVEI